MKTAKVWFPQAKYLGKMELTKIDISPDVVDAEDVEMLSDLIIAATNEALRYDHFFLIFRS